MCRRTTIPMQMRLMMSTVLGAILNPALSSEKYLAPPDEPFFDISIIITNTCKIYLLIRLFAHTNTQHNWLTQSLKYWLEISFFQLLLVVICSSLDVWQSLRSFVKDSIILIILTQFIKRNSYPNKERFQYNDLLLPNLGFWIIQQILGKRGKCANILEFQSIQNLRYSHTQPTIMPLRKCPNRYYIQSTKSFTYEFSNLCMMILCQNLRNTIFDHLAARS